PDEKKARFMHDYALSAYDAGVLVAERETAEFFETTARGRDAKAAANWVTNELAGRLNREGKDISASPVSAAQLATILDLIQDGTISGKIAKDLFEIVWSEGGDPRAVVEARGLKQVTDVGAIEKIIDQIIAANPDKVADARSNPKAIGWFVGQAMKASGGKANPAAETPFPKRTLGVCPPLRRGSRTRVAPRQSATARALGGVPWIRSAGVGTRDVAAHRAADSCRGGVLDTTQAAPNATRRRRITCTDSRESNRFQRSARRFRDAVRTILQQRN